MEFQLRPFQSSDLSSLLRYGNHPAIAANMTDAFPHPFTEERARQFIDQACQQRPEHILAIEASGEAIGAIGVHVQADVYRRNAELGYWLAEPFWGKGIMRAAIGRMVHYAFTNWPEILRIYARPYGTNLASQKALEKAGFSLEATLRDTIFKNGQFLDELIYAIRRG